MPVIVSTHSFVCSRQCLWICMLTVIIQVSTYTFSIYREVARLNAVFKTLGLNVSIVRPCAQRLSNNSLVLVNVLFDKLLSFPVWMIPDF